MPSLHALLRVHGREVLTVEADGAGKGRLDARDRAQQRGLARAVGADQRHQFAAAHVQADPGQRGDAAVAAVQAVDFKHCAASVPQVRLDHARVAGDFGRRALGELAAVVEHEHVVRHFHHQPHVVLDQHDRGAFGRQALDQRVDLARLGLVQSRRRFVQQQQFGLRAQRPRDLQALQRAVRHRAGGRVVVAREPHLAQQRVRGLAARGLGAHQRLRVQQRRPQRAAVAQVAAGHHVLQRGHVEEHLQVLERAADAGGRERVHRLAAQLDAAQPDAAGVGPVHAAQHVDQAGLAGAVGADDRMHRAAPHLHVQGVDRVHAAEGLRQVADVQQRRGGAHGDLRAHQRASVGTRPCGKNTIVPTSTAPKTIIS